MEKQVFDSKVNLLTKPVWLTKDIIAYTGFGKCKSEKIKKIAVSKYGGLVKYEPSAVKSESVLNYLGTTREQELSLLKGACNEETL